MDLSSHTKEDLILEVQRLKRELAKHACQKKESNAPAAGIDGSSIGQIVGQQTGNAKAAPGYLQKSESDLQTNNERYRTLLEAMTDGLFLFGYDWRHLIVNSKAAKLAGLAANELIGKTIHQVFPDFVSTESFRQVQASMTDRTVREIKWSFDVGTDTRWLSVKALPVADGLLCIVADITDSNKWQEELLESAQRLEFTLEASQTGTWYWNLLDNSLTWDERSCEIFGLSISEVQNYENFIGCLHPDDVERVNNLVAESVKGKTFFEAEYRVVHKDKSVWYVLAKGRVKYNDANEPLGMYGICMDLSDRIAQEHAIAYSEAKNKVLLSSLPQKVYYKNRKFVYETVNPSYAASLGLSPWELVGKSSNDFYTKEQAQERLAVEKLVLETGEVNRYKEEVEQGGEKQIYQVVISPVERDGRVRGVLGISWDISNEHRTEEALRSSLNLNRIMKDCSAEEILEYSVEEAERITQSKAAFIHYVREDDNLIDLQVWSKNTLKLCQVPNLMHSYPMDQAGIWAECIRQKKPMVYNDYSKALDKKGIPEGHFPLQRIATVPVIENGKVVAVIGVGNKPSAYCRFDVGLLELVMENTWIVLQQKRLESALKEAKETAENANRSKSIFLANMSHEIRTPMNSVIGFSELLQNYVQDPLQKSYLESIMTSGRTLLRLINDILDLSKIEAGKMSINPEAMYLEEMFSEISQIFLLKAQEKDLSLTFEVSKDLPPVVVVDELRIRQVLLNLVGNAIKFTSNGWVQVKAKPCSQAKDGKVDLQIEINDTGIGIAKEQQEQIFESFSQQEEQDERFYGGTGLGLAITRKLVELMGGQIRVESELGEGSSFILSFKGIAFTGVPQSSYPSFEYKKILFKSATVLVVDDIEGNRYLVKGMLRETSLQIVEAVNGKEAVALAKEYQPDLILMDIRMPEMGGHEATRQIRKFDAEVPIVALTASLNVLDHYSQGVEMFDGCLLKPISMAEMFLELSRFLPYERVEDSVADSSSDASGPTEFSRTPKEQLLAFCSVLEGELMPAFMDVNGSLHIDQYERFAKSLLQKSQEYGVLSFEELGRQLASFTQNFDIDNMKACIHGFPHKVTELKSYLETLV